jgi:hypothetical protein
MVTVVAVTLVCWCCALIVRPHPRLLHAQSGHPVLVRRLGRQQQVLGIAVAATLVALMSVLVTLPAQPNAQLRDLRVAQATCGQAAYGVGVPTCFEMQPGGRWEEAESQGDGQWMVVATMSHLPARAIPADSHDGIKG